VYEIEHKDLDLTRGDSGWLNRRPEPFGKDELTMSYTVAVKCECATVYLLLEVEADDEHAAEELAMKTIEDAETHDIRKNITRIDFDDMTVVSTSPHD
jgi:hypothetical protein